MSLSQQPPSIFNESEFSINTINDIRADYQYEKKWVDNIVKASKLGEAALEAVFQEIIKTYNVKSQLILINQAINKLGEYISLELFGRTYPKNHEIPERCWGRCKRFFADDKVNPERTDLQKFDSVRKHHPLTERFKADMIAFRILLCYKYGRKELLLAAENRIVEMEVSEKYGASAAVRFRQSLA